MSLVLSDYHKSVWVVLKTSIVENKPRELQNGNSKYFVSRWFNRDLKEKFSHEYVNSCNKFDEIFLNVLNKHTPPKKAYFTKALRLKLLWKDLALL